MLYPSLHAPARCRKEFTHIKGGALDRRSFVKTGAAAGIAAAALGGAGLLSVGRMRPAFDIVITGGTLLDGTGAESRLADIGIRDGKITAVGTLTDATAARIVDARSFIVSPGFIDIHSHLDTSLFTAPRAESKIHQGVTTTVTGNCGGSAAPIGGPEMAKTLAEFKDDFGFDCPYRDMDGFFTFLKSQGTAINLLSLVGLGDVRAKIVGMDNRPATKDEIASMQRETALAIEQGCFGASTGLEYTPGSFASTEELIEVMKGVPEKHRLYATHMRNEDNRVLEAIEEAIAIARGSGARLQVSHLKAQNRANWPKQAAAIALLERGIADGMEIHTDRYPYVAYSTTLAALFPLWSRDGGTDKFLGRLKETTDRNRIRAEVLGKVDGLGSWESIMISSVSKPGNKQYQGRTVQQITDVSHADPFDFVANLMLDENGGVGMVGFGMDEPGTELVLQWKNTMVCSDAGAFSPWGHGSRSNPHPRGYGSFPRAIAHYQRTRNITTLPDMIRKMTSLPASKLGLTDRGIIAPGNAADIVVFDYQTLQDKSTFIQPHQFPEGMPFVIVNGSIVVDNGVNTGALAGSVIRST
jgi:N-acyl-D-amino-acid deacylase